MAQVNSGHRVCVVMPTYNERDNLEPTLTDLFLRNAGVDVLIVDDNSPDGTGTLADVISRVTRLPQDLNVEHNENDVLRDVSFADEDSDSSLYSDCLLYTSMRGTCMLSCTKHTVIHSDIRIRRQYE